MADPLALQRWIYRAIFVGFAALFYVIRILPLSTLPPTLPGPDLMIALAFAWILRRPDFVPAPLIIAVFLLEDLLYHRPPGLWAAIVLLGTEFIRGRVALLRGLPFPVEWAMVAAVLVAMTLLERLLLAAALVPQATLTAEMLRVLTTMIAYPVVVLATRFVFALHDPEQDRLGRRA